MTLDVLAERISAHLTPIYEGLGKVFAAKYALIPIPFSCDGKQQYVRQYHNFSLDEGKSFISRK